MTGPLTTNRDMSDAEEALRMAGDVAERLVAEARQKAVEVAAEARTKAEEAIAAGRAKAEEIIHEARTTADRVAREKHQEILESLAEGRKSLETQFTEMQALEREYRTHLLEYMEGQLAVLKSGVYSRASEPPK
jgi:cell division septum initiation protein DivIVA